MDPNTGRFLNEDPLGFIAGDQNLYRYVLSNPVNFFDPFGLEVGDWWDFPANFERAGEIGQELLQEHQGHNNLDDAVRHAEWQRRTAEETNDFTAEAAGTGHELQNLLEGDPLNESIMDLIHNSEGRAAARENRPVNPDNLRTDPNSSTPCYYCNDPYDSTPNNSSETCL